MHLFLEIYGAVAGNLATLKGVLEDTSLAVGQAINQALGDRAGLWNLLVVITARKAKSYSRRETRQKRGGGGALKLLWWQGPTLLNPHFATGTKDQDGSRIVVSFGSFAM